MDHKQIELEFNELLVEYGMEAIIYAFRFEQQITALEARLWFRL